MLLSKLIAIGSIAIGGALAGTHSAIETATIPVPISVTSAFANHYFQFTGANGEEDQPAKWEEITQAAYQLVNCSSNFRGCKLIATDVTEDASGELHPTQVYVETDPGNNNNKSPILGTGITEVKNRDASY